MAEVLFIGGASFSQELGADLAADITTTANDPVFTNLLSIPITTTGNDLLLEAGIGFSATAFVLVEGQIWVDGAPVVGGDGVAFAPTGGGTITAVKLRHPVAPGPHTVTLEFAKIPGSVPATVISVLAASSPARHFAYLRVKEYSA